MRHQEEADRCAIAVSQAKQGRWMRWEGVERRKITWSELWNTESNILSFTIRATYDVLPSPTNLHLWFGEDPACLQCFAPATLKHILVGCKTSLMQGRYTWRHNQVLKCLAVTLESKRVTVNAMPLEAQTTFRQPTSFVREGEKRLTNRSPPDSCPPECSSGLENAGRLKSEAHLPTRNCSDQPAPRPGPLVQILSTCLYSGIDSPVGGSYR